MLTHYETLGLDRSATAEQIKRAFRQLASLNHPDREGGDPEAMAAINRAYEVLSDPERRARYDETGSDTPQVAVEAEARQIILKVFADVMFDDDIMGSARAHVQEGKRKLDEQRQQAEDTLRKIARKEGKVRVKRGDNLVEMLLAQRRAECDERIKQCDRADRVHAATVELLDAYESDAPPPMPIMTPRFVFPPGATGFHWRGE